MTSWLPHAVVAILVVLAPLLDPIVTACLKRSTHPLRRIWNYLLGMLAIGLFALVGALYSPSDWWLSSISVTHWAWPVIAVAVVGLLTYQFIKPVYKVLSKPELRAKTHSQFKPLEFMLPQSLTERWIFVAVCLTAGFGEEVVFRGFLIRYFEAGPFHFPAALACLASVLAFGLNHAYQGWKGMMSTAIIALGFTLMTIGFGSLVPVMVIHALLDLRVLLFTLPEGHRLLNNDAIKAA